MAQATLQNIEVYSTGQWTPPPSAGGQTTAPNTNLKIVTFIVDHQEALILKYIKDSGGTIDIVVRSLDDNDQAATDPPLQQGVPDGLAADELRGDRRGANRRRHDRS